MKTFFKINLLVIILFLFNLGFAQNSPLKDKNGRLLGVIKVKNDGVMEIRNKNGFYLGKYNPKTNTTYDRNGNIIGRGNLLVTFLK